jgi:uncharacterized protein YndB with AHSA1/START domain
LLTPETVSFVVRERNPQPVGWAVQHGVRDYLSVSEGPARADGPARFWGPTGTHTSAGGITADVRPGGVFETVMVSDADGSRYTMRAVYVEVVPPERLVWTEPGTGVTTPSTFTDLSGSRTEVRIHQRNVPSAFLAPGAQAGLRSSLDRFAQYLATRPGPVTP